MHFKNSVFCCGFLIYRRRFLLRLIFGSLQKGIFYKCQKFFKMDGSNRSIYIYFFFHYLLSCFCMKHSFIVNSDWVQNEVSIRNLDELRHLRKQKRKISWKVEGPTWNYSALCSSNLASLPLLSLLEYCSQDVVGCYNRE